MMTRQGQPWVAVAPHDTLLVGLAPLRWPASPHLEVAFMRPPSRGRTPICVSAAVRERLLGRARRARFPAKLEYCCRTDIQAAVGACPSPRARDCDPNNRRNAAADVFCVAISSPLFLSLAAKVRDRRRRNRTQRSTTMCARRKNLGRNHTSSV